MSVVITERPQKTVSSIGEISRWTAVWHPNIWRFQRKDATVNTIAEYEGGCILELEGYFPEVLVDHQLYFSGSDISTVCVVTAVDYNVMDGLTTVHVTVLDPADFTLGDQVDTFVNFISSRTYYRLEININTFESPVLNLDDYPQFRPNSKGEIKADLQSWLQTLVSAEDQFEYDVPNDSAPYLGQSYRIQWREYWKEEGTGGWEDDTIKHYIVNAARQIGDKYGQNMGEFVVFPPDQASPIEEGSKGKFLTKFSRPTFFVGYPFSFSFIYSLEYAQSLLYAGRFETRQDINGETINTEFTTLSEHAEVVNRLQMVGGYAENIKAVKYVIGWKDTYVDDDYVDDDYISEGIGHDSSEEIMVDINQACEPNPVYLKWLNPLGGYDYWLFHTAQNYKDTVSGERSFEKYIEDLADERSRHEVISKDVQEEIDLGADGLTYDKMEGIRYMLSSPKVYQWMGEEDGAQKWRVVRVKTGTFDLTKTDENKASILFTIMPPERYTQKQ